MFRKLTLAATLGVTLLAGLGSAAQAQNPLYTNLPQGTETVFSTGTNPRTSLGDEAFIPAISAQLTSMRFGYLVAAGGPAAFDVRIRMFDNIDFAATATTPQFTNQIADFTLPFTGQVAGAFTTGPISLTGLPGGFVNVTSNAANFGQANIADVYLQFDYLQPGTQTAVAGNLVTGTFDGTGADAGYTFSDPRVGGTGATTEDIYWRDASANQVINGGESRSFVAPNRANLVLSLSGVAIAVPEPGSVALMLLGGLPLAGVVLRRRRK